MAIPTKKIPELDPYGSVNNPARLKDLYEVSKNIGTYGTPDYPVNSSRKITHEELVDGIGGIPYSGQNYEVVKATGNAAQNGVNLLAAIAACNAKTPNGLSLTSANRATVYLLSGGYDIPTAMLANGLVNIEGVGRKEDIKIFSTSLLTSIIVVSSANVVYKISNLTISNASGLSIAHGTGIVDVGVWDNVIISAATDAPEWDGQYYNVKCSVGAVLQGSILSNAIVENCSFLNNSCGYSASSAVTISGTVKKCTSTGTSFGRASGGGVIISGLIEDCESPFSSFGNSNASGFEVLISGIIRGCKSTGDNNYGSSSSGGCNVVISGIIQDCESGIYSFGGNSASPTLVTVSGKIKNCKGGNFSFGKTSAIGVIEGCEGSGTSGVHLGTIYNCRFKNISTSLKDVITIGDGASVKYTESIQLEITKDSIKISSGANVKISHCESNKDFNIVSGAAYTNLISNAYNVIDSDLI